MKGAGALIFIAGAAIGAVASYFITKKNEEKKYNDSLVDIRNMYDERVKKIEQSRENLDEMNKKKAEIMQDIEKKVEQEKLKNPETEFTDYSSISRYNKKKPEITEPIKLITEAEVQQYAKDYELIGMSLYDDDVLIDDETENIFKEYDHLIGDQDFDELRRNSVDGGVYILNTERKAIYDITIMDERFGDDYEPIEIH